ncbi:MAG: AAA family ATPase [Candidatus Zhuqueibacterota bacterium]
MYISRLKLINWKNFGNIDIPLQPRTFIVGANASGKSNLLDAIRFLRDIAKNGGGLQYAVNNVRGGVKKIRNLSARQETDITIEIELSDADAKKPEWLYRLKFNQVGGGVRDLKPTLREEIVWYKDTPVLERSFGKFSKKESTKVDRLSLSTFLEQPSQNDKFWPLVEIIRDIQYLHIIPHLVRLSHQVIMPEEQADYFGKDIIQRINHLNKKTQLSYLKKIGKVLEIAVPQFKQITLQQDGDGVPHIQAIFQHWRAKGARQWEDQFSDGTLRLIGLLWALLDGTKPLLLEEPELSLNAAIVSRLSETIASLQQKKNGQRQVIVSTHSFDLLNNSGISTKETIMLIPGENGTEARCANDDLEIRTLLESGMTVGETVIQQTAPKNIQRMTRVMGD